MTDDHIVDFISEDSDDQYHCQIVVIITDYGSQIAEKNDRVSTIKHIVKAMGGNLKITSDYSQTSFPLYLPCHCQFFN